jgi:SPP1 gp7 family putative phage head morphogenesis protein
VPAASRSTIRTSDDSPRVLRERSRVKTAQATRAYEAQLRKIARITGQLIESTPQAGTALQYMLRAYAKALVPWAQRTAWRMLQDVDDRSRETWRALGQQISFGLKKELESAPVGQRMRELLHTQVGYIQSIPLEAAERVEKLSLEGLIEGKRSKVIAEEIARSGEVAKSRAIMIARTATSAAATTLVQARAEAIGSEGYLWRTVRDPSVRSSHRLMEGKFVRWDDPPTIDGWTGHAGTSANCRCFPQSVIDHDPLR